MNKVRIHALSLAILLLLQLPWSKTTAADVTRGSLSETVTWKYENRTLTLIGEGSIEGLSEKNEAPWYHLREGITTVVIGEGIENVGKFAFKDLTELEKVRLPSTLKVIGVHAFRNCTNMEYIDIPSGVVSILRGAFNGCTSLKSFTMPDSVETIESDVFKNCTNLKTVRLSQKLTFLPSNSFAGCSSLAGITLPKSITSIGYSAFMDCSSLTGVEFMGKVTQIDFYAFRDCVALEAVEFPSSLERIGSEAFSGCRSMQSIRFKGDLPEISDLAFYLNKPYGADPCVIYYPENNQSWIQGKQELLLTRFEDDYVLKAYTPSDCDHVAVMISGKDATCTENGLTEGKYCSLCGKVLKKQTAIDALDHNLIAITVQPTCTASGYELHQCSRCSYRENVNSMDALGHTFSEWETVKEPTAEDAGLAQRTCVNCTEIQQQQIEKLPPPHTEPPPQPATSDENIQLAPAASQDRTAAGMGVFLILLAIAAAIVTVKWLTQRRP